MKIDQSLKDEVVKQAMNSAKAKSKLAQAMADIIHGRVSTAPFTTCPECFAVFSDRHPDNECSLKDVCDVMGT